MIHIGHGRKGGSGLCAGQRTCGGKDATVDTLTIIE
jgi:hypothetical protein